MMRAGGCVTPSQPSGSRSSGVHTLSKRFALTLSHEFSGICAISGKSGEPNT